MCEADAVDRYKTELCRSFHAHGYCAFDSRCKFIHDGRSLAHTSLHTAQPAPLLCSPLPSHACSAHVLCAEYRVRAGECEYWLVSPSERVVRVELVNPANTARLALLQLLCAEPAANTERPSNRHSGCGRSISHTSDDCRLRRARRWATDMKVGVGPAGGDRIVLVDTQTMQSRQHQPVSRISPISLLPLEQVDAGMSRSVEQMSVGLSTTLPLCTMQLEAESTVSARGIAAGRQLSSLSALSCSPDPAVCNSRSVTAPMFRPVAQHGQSSPQLCPTTPPLPQPSPFVLSTEESPPVTHRADYSEADVCEPTLIQPARACTMHRTHATEAPSQPSPVLFPRRLHHTAAPPTV